jgi:hypothetical protein
LWLEDTSCQGPAQTKRASVLPCGFVGNPDFGQAVAQRVAGEAEQARGLALVAAAVPGKASHARGPLDEPREFLFCQRSLLEDALQERVWNVLGVNRHCDAEFRLHAVEQPGVAACLVMYVEASAQECLDDFLGLEDGKLF